MFSPSINQLIESLKKLPSVGQHTAERYVFHWLHAGKGEVNELKDALDNLLKNTKSCSVCWNFSDKSPCEICTDTKRDHKTICVVSEPQDLQTIEKVNAVILATLHKSFKEIHLADIIRVCQEDQKAVLIDLKSWFLKSVREQKEALIYRCL